MGIIAVLGGCTSPISNNQGFGNYGAGPSNPSTFSSYPIYFSLPSAGVIGAISISTNEFPTGFTQILLENIDGLIINNDLFLDENTKENFHLLPNISFSAGDRLRCGLDGPDLPGNRTVIAWYCTLTDANYFR